MLALAAGEGRLNCKDAGCEGAMKRYILNLSAKTVHDRNNLTERCNTDDIKDRDEIDPREVEDLGAAVRISGKGMFWKCYWCFK
jgi:hypothetical protein